MSQAAKVISDYEQCKRWAISPWLMDNEDVGYMNVVRTRFFKGETVGLTEVPEGASSSLTGQVVRLMRLHGYIFDEFTEGEGRAKRKKFRLANPEYLPDEAAIASARQVRPSRSVRKAIAAKRAAKKAPAKRTRKAAAAKRGRKKRPPEQLPDFDGLPERTTATSTLPSLGDTVTVVAQTLGDDGSVRLILKNGTRAWECRLEGATAG